MKRWLSRALGALIVVFSLEPASAQITRSWVEVSRSDSSLPSVLSLGQLVESSPGGRGAIVSWMDASTTTVVVAQNDGSIKKIVYTSGTTTPTVTTATINNGMGGSYKIRNIVRTPNGRMFMVVSSAAEGQWNGTKDVAYNPAPYYTGGVYFSLDDGTTWDLLRGSQNNGQIAVYPASATGSIGGYALRLGGAGIAGSTIMEFGSQAQALAALGLGLTYTQNGTTVYFGVGLDTTTNANPDTSTQYDSTIGEPVVSGGAVLTWPVRFQSNYFVEGSNCGCSGGTYYTHLRGYGTTWFGKAFNTGVWWGKSWGDGCVFWTHSPFIQDYSYWQNDEYNSSGGTACNSVNPGDKGTNNGYEYIWHHGNVDSNRYNRREKVVNSFDNSGMLLRARYDAFTPTYSGQDYSGDESTSQAITGMGGGVDGVIVYRGSATTSAAPSVIMAGGNTTDSKGAAFFANAQEGYAGFNGFTAVVASDASGGQAKAYVSENTIPFASGTSMVETSFGTTSTTRMMLTAANQVDWTTSAATTDEWNGRLLAVAQDGWSLGSPSKTRLAIFVVPTTVALSATVDGTTVTGSNYGGCSVVLHGTVTGEPGAKIYYWWQKATSGAFTAINSVAQSGVAVATIPATGTLSVADYTCSASGQYRLVVAGELGGVVYDATESTAALGQPSNATVGRASSTASVSMTSTPTISSPAILKDNSAIGTTSATVCSEDSVQLSVVLDGSGTVQWTLNGANVGTGTTLYISPVNTSGSDEVFVYSAAVSGTCGSGNATTFTLTVGSSIGNLGITRISSVTGTTDPVNGCSGTTTNFNAAATGANIYAWAESVDNSTFGVVSTGSSSYVAPRLASGPALNQNYSFENDTTGWSTGQWVALTPPGGAPHGTIALNGTVAQDIRSTDYILIDSSKPYLYAAVAKNAAQAGTAMTLILECYDKNKAATSPSSIALPGVTLVSSWSSYGAFVGGGTSHTFPTGTAFVRLRVSMPASAAPGAYLDDVRLIPVAASEMSLVSASAAATGTTVAQYWDSRAGYDASGTANRNFYYKASASNACESILSTSQQVMTLPKVWFMTHDILDADGNSIMVPDDSPSNPLVATICGANNITLEAPAVASGSIGYVWQSCTDYNASNGNGSWVLASGASQSPYYSLSLSSSASGSTTYYRLVATGGCDGLPYQSRVFKIVQAPTPTLLVDLSAPSTACSQNPVTLGLSYVNGTLVWEQSLNAGSWTVASPVPSLATQSGNAYTFTVQVPQVTGNSTNTIAYRARLTSGGCSDVVSTARTITISPEITYGALTINGAMSSTASLCPSDSATLNPNVTGANTYQWYSRAFGTTAWAAVTGETAPTLSLLAPTQTVVTTYQYYVRSYGNCGATSDSGVFTLTFKEQAQITTQPSVPAQTCSGTMQAISFSSAGASAFSWTETSSDGSMVMTYPQSSSITAPALASGAALNPDPSFETGLDGVQRIAGATGSSVAWDRTTTAYLGSSSIHTYNGAITLQHPAGSTLVPVDATMPYIVVAGAYSSGNLPGSLGVIAFDSNKVEISRFWLNSATSVSLGTAWKPLAGLLNAGGTTTAFPTGTVYVQLLVRLNEGGTTEEGLLDDLRIIPLGSDELGILNNSIPNGTTLGAFWDGRAGRDASGSNTRTFSYVGTAISQCGSVQTQSVTVTAVPKPFITSQPSDTLVCGGSAATLSAGILGGGTQSYTWQRSSDGTQWTAISGANTDTYSFTADAVQATTTFKARLVAISSCGTVVTRVATVTVQPSPTITTDLDVQSSACSGDTISMHYSAFGATPVFQASQDGGGWATITPTLISAGNYQITLPTVSGSAASSYSIRAVLTSIYGCTTVTSATKTVTIHPATTIATQPTGLVECLSSPTGALTVAATGTNLTYLWQVSANGSWNNIAGATSYYFVPTPPAGTTTDYTASYRCIISGDCGGTLTSANAVVTMYAAPVITTQPASKNIASGNKATLVVAASGTGNTYQWQVSQDGSSFSNISGATGTTYTTETLSIPSSLSATTVYYRVVVSGLSNACSSATSSTAQVVVYPILAANPSLTMAMPACSGTLVGMNANLTSGASVSTQWQLQSGSGWADVAGASSPYYSATNTATGSASVSATYRPVFTDAVGQTLIGNTVTVTWVPALAFTTQPASKNVASGNNVTLTVAANGVGNTYQWQVSQDGSSFSNISGATGTTYTTETLSIPSSLSATTVYYRVVASSASNACASVTSSTAQVVVYPMLSANPSLTMAMPACSGTLVGMNANLTSGASVSTQWQIQSGSTWVDVAGATSPYYSATNTATGSTSVSVTYRPVFTDAVGQTLIGNTVTVTWVPALAFTTQPASKNIASGNKVTFTVAANGVGNTYQWQVSQDGSSFSNISGATGTSYTTDTLSLSSSLSTTTFYYRVVASSASNACASVTSSTAQVVVYPTLAASPSVATAMPACSGIAVGMNANLTSGASVSTQWQIQSGSTWADVAGATGPYYSVTNTATGSVAASVSYRPVFTDAVGQTLTGNSVTVTWVPTPIVTTQPAGSTICAGGNATLSFAYTGVPTTAVQWQMSADGSGWSSVNGGTQATLSLTNLTSTTYYRAKLSTLNGGCTDVYTAATAITVNPQVAITVQPTGATICSGDSAALAVTAVGTNLTYRWERSNGSGWQSVTNGTGPSVNVALTNQGNTDTSYSFRVTVSGDCGTAAVSQVVSVIVHPGITIQAQPAATTTVCNGGSTSLYFAGTGFSAISWQMSSDNGTTWNNAGSTTTGITTGALTSGTYLYRAQVTDACGDISYTNIATVIAKAIAQITSQPVAVTICSGQSATFSVAANVSDATFQWYTASSVTGSWGAVSGATNASLTLSNQANQTGSASVSYYRVVVTPASCDQPITSSAVALTVRPGTAVTSQPTAVDTCLNSSATTTVGYTGENATVQWQISDLTGAAWTDIAGATNATLQVPTSATGVWQVRAAVTGGCGTVYSSGAQVRISGATSITSQPVSATACEGSSASFAVGASGAALTYQWQRSTDGGTSWTAVGSSNSTLTVIATTTSSYRVVVYGGGGCNDQVVSSVATLTVISLPQDVPLEAPTYALAGNQVYLQVADSGPAYDSVTWQLGSQTKTGNSAVFLVPSEPGVYTVNVVATKSGCQSVTSWNLDVESKGNGDYNQDSSIDGRDFSRFEAAYGTKAGERGFDEALDLNGDGVIDSADEDLFMSGFGGSVKSTTTTSALIENPMSEYEPLRVPLQLLARLGGRSLRRAA